MEKQMHRLLSFMLSLILVVGLIPGTMMAYAVEYTEITSVALTGAPESYIVGEMAGTLAVPKASAEYSVEVALNGYSLGEKVEDAYVFENSDTVDLYDFNDDGTFFCIFEDDGTGCSDWSSVVTTFEANKDYWLVIALTKQGGDALPETDLDADNFKLINGCADKYTVFDDDLWWVEFKLNRLSDAAPSVYNITFDANGGSVAPVSATTGNDGKLTSLPTPTHTSPYMTFDGWYTGKTGDTKVTADTVFTSDTTIYARWNADYAIEVTLNGYEPGKKVADTTFSENSDTVDIDRENCHIFTEKDGEPDWDSEVTEFEANKDYWLVIALTKQGGDELTYADLTADDVNLTNDYTAELIDYDDGLWWVSYKLKPLENSVSTPTVIDELHISGVTMPVVGAMPINFATTSTPGVTIGEDIFWVRYVPETNNLTDLYDDNTNVDNTPFRSGIKYFLQVILEPQNGYTIAADAKIFYNGIQLPMPDASLSQSCATVHPEGTMAMALIGGEASVPATYTVIFNSDGGSVVTAQTVEEGKTANEPANPTKEGYTFKGWYLGETEYDFETPISGDITLKAQWEVIPTVSVIDEIHISGVTMPVVGAMPINFATTSTPGVTIGEDTFWVRYVPETNNLTDLYDDNTYVDNTPFRSGVKYFLQVILEPQNGCTIATDAKIFYKGIQLPMPDASLSQSCATVHPEGTMAMALIDGETSVPAYTVTFDCDGGSAVAAQNVESGKTASKPTDPIKEGYTFRGWYLGETEYDFETPVSGDITLKAKWESVVEEPKHTCDIKPVAKDEPSCTEGGKEAYYKCEDCGKFYEDALGAKEITDINAWGNLPKLDHTESEWMSDKDNHWKECTVTACGVILENSKAAHKDNNKDGKCDVCEYNVGISGGSSEDDKPSDNPQTGDNNMMWLWIALLFVGSAGITATTVAEKKKLSVK